MIGAEYTKVLRVPTAKMQRNKDRRPCRLVDCASASYPMFPERLVQVLSDNAEILHEPRVLLTKRHMFKEYW
jgi:hypothetical protein